MQLGESSGIKTPLVGPAVVAADPYYLSRASLVLDANEGVLKSGGSAAAHLDGVATWQNQATGPKNFLHLPGIASSYAYVPHHTDFEAFGDFALEATNVTMPDWTPSTVSTFVAKWYGSYSIKIWWLGIHTDGKVRLDVSYNGSAATTYYSSIATGLAAGATASFRAIRSGSNIIFQMDTGAGFAALGSTTTGAATTTLHGSSSAAVELGGNDGGTAQTLTGRLGGVKVWNTATPDSSTPVLDVDFSLASRGDASFACTSGQTVTTQNYAATQRAIGSDAIMLTSSYRGNYLTPSADDLPAAHFPGVANNYFQAPDAANLDGFTDFTLEAKGVTFTDWTPSAEQGLISKWNSGSSNRSYSWRLMANGKMQIYVSFDGNTPDPQVSTVATGVADGATADLMVMRNGTAIRFYVNGVKLGDDVAIATTAVASKNGNFRVGTSYNTNGHPMTGKMERVRCWNSAVANQATPTESPVLDMNFEVDATHGAASFTATTGQTVTTTTSGDNPCRVIGYPVVRFDGSDDYFKGQFSVEPLTGGRLFVVCSVLGGGGEDHARVFSTSKDGGSVTTTATGAGLFIREVSTANWRTYHNSAESLSQSSRYAGRLLAQVDFAASAQSSKSNNANEQTATADWSGLDSNEYGIAAGSDNGAYSAAVDIEFIALYPASMTDTEAALVVAELNKRFSIY